MSFAVALSKEEQNRKTGGALAHTPAFPAPLSPVSGDVSPDNVASMTSMNWSPLVIPSMPISQSESSLPSVTFSIGTTGGDDSMTTGKTPGRRTKRLERNRESARLSRRRRKQYLEILEDRVNALSVEMDKGRRMHVQAAIPTVKELRQRRLAQMEQDRGKGVPVLEHHVRLLDTSLSRTSDELRIAATFQKEQFLSLTFPASARFLLWLTLQNEVYFRGGRASSERLSAARIGERMLQSGSDKVVPAHGMWPLVCSEVGLSYDQEEKLRCFQKTLLTTPETWLHRHTALAASKVIEGAHGCFQGVSEMVQQRERSLLNVLTVEQRSKFLVWAAKKRGTLSKLAQKHAPPPMTQQQAYQILPEQHEAANLYILNHQLEQVKAKLPNVPALVPSSQLKRLARRPSFESLASSASSLNETKGGHKLSRDNSLSSSGSLKRSASEQSMDTTATTEKGNVITPEAAQVAALPTITAALGSLGLLVPPMPTPSSFAPPAPAAPTASLALDMPTITHMNVVPEEGYLNNFPDFLFDLAEEDWAIGEGFDMEIS